LIIKTIFMKKIIFLFVMLFVLTNINAQNPGDTIVVKAFKYGSPSRDSMITFPPGNLTFEKIILKYNMRCKNALISTQSLPNQGCGEWDYSCNTYVVDSTKIEQSLNTTPSHKISNFTGNTFIYTNQTIFDFYNFTQTNVVLNNIVSENQYTLGVGSSTVANLLKSDEKSGRSQILYTAAELIAAGFSAGNIDGIILNVTNVGGGVNFFKTGIKQTTVTALNNSTPDLTGFTNVYNSNYSFANGNNRVQFHTPFVWNGTSNVLIDFSFTNTVPNNPIVFNGAITPSVMALYSKNNYAVDLGSFGHVAINTASLLSINTKLTVSFWAYGNSALLPTNTSILYGYATNPNERSLNIHLPWSDNSVYFDCGFQNNGFDRINKAATVSEQGGQWNHWTFTKNTVTGSMKIYLNGILWHSGTSLTKTISILNLILGKDKDFLNNYKGKVNELTIWDEELTLPNIQAWMNKPIDVTHPNYANLLAYYKMNEANGQNLTDSKNNLISAGTNLQWTYDRGDKLTRMFNETTLRPNVVFLRGIYAVTNTTLTVKDSVARNPNVVMQYSVVNNNTVMPMSDDAVNLISTTNLFETLPSKTYNGDLNTLTGTVAVVPTGTINITTLNYYRRYPFYNEILSFVTPYGKGLDLGVNGKTWYYDVSDFAPVLKGSKRFMMAMGGQYQEQMDIDFWFIVGTPPRTVLEFNQLWQGGARDGGATIGSINADTRFNIQNVSLLNNGQYFKVRSTITGHGAQGEFDQNGGYVFHYLNVNGGANEYVWKITEECSGIPIYPQGGTWLYDRQGWCPGNTSYLRESNITPFVTPGNTITLDYSCSNQPIPGGDYRYIEAHQLITYGGPNRSLDANIVDVLAPSNKVAVSRKNSICANPVILVQNTGSTAITSMDIDYWVNGSNIKQAYQWTGTLAFMDTVSVKLPISALWQNGLQPSGNIFHAEIKKANTVTDDYSFNNLYHSAFTIPAVVTSSFSVEFKTNNYPDENTYRIEDEIGNIVGASSFTAGNTIFLDNYVLNGCYKLIVTDASGDGVQWWANTGQGVGYIKLKDNLGAVIKTFQPDFGSGFEYSFTTDSPLTLKENELNSLINLYPNPTYGKFIIEGNELENSEIKITDLLGRIIDVRNIKGKQLIEVDGTIWNPGIYFVNITKNNLTVTKKVVVY